MLTTFFTMSMLVAAPQRVHAAENLIQNPGVETPSADPTVPASWSKDSFGRNTPIFTYPVAGPTSARAIKVELTQRQTGDAKWVFAPVPISGGQTYTFSDKYLATTQSRLVAAYTTSSGTQYVELKSLPVASTWMTASVDITAPANATHVTVYHLIRKAGSLTTDDHVLTQKTTTDTLAPSATLTAPGSGATVQGTTTLTATATDNVGVTKVEFFVDNVKLSEDTTSPYSASWNTTATANGSHVLTAKAFDAAGNVGTSSAVTVTVSNTTTPPSAGNLVSNPSLELATSNPAVPDNWLTGGYGTNQRSFTYPVSAFDGARAARIDMSGYSNGDAKWFFAPVPIQGGASYTFSNYSQSNISTSLTVRYLLSTGTFQYSTIATVPASSTWRKNTATFTVPTDATQATVFHLIAGNGFLVVDNYSLTKNSGDTNPDTFSQGMVTLAFDDGFRSTYQNGLPILNAAGLKSTQNILTNAFDDPDYVTEQEVLAMQAQGHEIAAHTRTHRDLTQLSEAEIRNEVTGSRNDLLNIGASPVETFVYPYGEYNDQIKQIVQESGFAGARSVQTGYNTKTSDRFALLDQHVESNTTVAQAQGWIDTALANKTWLIMEFHRIESNGGQYSATPATLQGIVNHLVSRNALVVTMREGIQRMGF